MIGFLSIIISVIKVGRKDMFYLTTHSIHFIYDYMASDYTYNEEGNPLPPHGLLFPISSNAS